MAHELPAEASAAIFREAYRLLRPGGAVAVMEVRLMEAFGFSLDPNT